MQKTLSRRIEALEQKTPEPISILVRWQVPIYTLSSSDWSIAREPDETEAAFIARGRALAKTEILFGR
jgi:hypothetical protein